MGVFSVLLYSDSIDRFYEAVSFMAAARARGEKCLLFLRGPALRAFAQDRWAAPAPGLPPAEKLRFQHRTPMEMLRDLHGHGNVSLYACSAWVRLLSLEPEALGANVDAVVGLNAFLAQAQGGPILSF